MEFVALVTIGPLVVATVIAFSYTWLAWGHPWGLLCFTLEAVIVGRVLNEGSAGLAAQYE